MGTRADFYIGRGENAEWLGSIAWDGDPWPTPSNPEWREYTLLSPVEQVEAMERGDRPTAYVIPDGEHPLLAATTVDEARAAMHWVIDGRDDGTPAASGWPWPWEDSQTTDYAYAYEDGEVYVSNYGSAWYQPHKGEDCPSDAAWEAVEAADNDRKAARRNGHNDPQALVAAELAYRQAADNANRKAATFPDMTAVQDVNWGAGSGIVIIQPGAPQGVSPHED